VIVSWSNFCLFREEERIDKKKLLAIAKKNATYILKEQQERMLQAGVIPSSTVSSKPGKSVAELTGLILKIKIFCDKLIICFRVL